MCFSGLAVYIEKVVSACRYLEKVCDLCPKMTVYGLTRRIE